MRIIDADALIQDFNEAEFVYDGDEDGHYPHDVTDLMRYILCGIINDAPTIDAVEVVRCRECKHWICNPNTEEWGKCKWISDEQFDVVMNDDDFCSYGEREGE